MAQTNYKDQGNEEFKNGNYLKAAALYTHAIKQDPTNAVLYSNRSASLLKLKKVTKALEDAEECIKLKPDWEKGYFRKGAILEETDKQMEALHVYQQAQAICPENKELSLKVRNLARVLKVSAKQEAETLESMIKAAVGSGKIADFCLECMDLAGMDITEHGANIPAVFHFLPGDKSEPHEDNETHIRAGPAFNSPELLTNFISQMRLSGQRYDAQAICAIVAKSSMAYPQVWLKAGWPCGKQTGVFVQLETKEDKKVWFIPVLEKVPGKPVPLNAQEFAPLSSILK